MNPQTDTPESAEAMTPKKGYGYKITGDLMKIAQAHPETARTIENAISHISADWPPCPVERGEIGIVHAHLADLKHPQHAQQSDTAVGSATLAAGSAALTAANAALSLKLQRCEEALEFYAEKKHFHQVNDPFLDDTTHRYMPAGAIVEHGEKARAALPRGTSLPHPTRNEGEKKV